MSASTSRLATLTRPSGLATQYALVPAWSSTGSVACSACSSAIARRPTAARLSLSARPLRHFSASAFHYTKRFRAASSSTAPPSPPPPAPSPSSSSSATKLETLPFVLQPTQAQHTLDSAAHSTFGLSFLFQHYLSKFLRKWFGYDLDTGVVRRAFRPVLLPTWRVDLSMDGKGLIEDTEFQLSITATDASVCGFSLPPLSHLSATSAWDSEPEPFDRAQHARQLDMDVTVLDYSVGPLKLLARLASMPRTNVAKHGVGIDPSAFKAKMFAAYPLYIPVYMAEYECVDDQRRVTTVAMAASESTAFAIFPSFLPEATWLPSGGGVEIAVGGAPTDFTQPTPPKLMETLKPKLDTLMESLGPKDPGAKMALLADACDEAEIQRNPRAMRFSENAERNREYIDALQRLAAVEAMIRQIEVMGDNVRAVVIGPRGPKLATRDNLVAETQARLAAAKMVVEQIKPDWLKDIEQQVKSKPLAAGYSRGR